jgi:hypothetical protein
MTDFYIGSLAEKGMCLAEAHRPDISAISVLEELSREGRWVVYVLIATAVIEGFENDSFNIYGSAGPIRREEYKCVFDDFTDYQKTAVYEIVGRLLEYYKGGPYE